MNVGEIMKDNITCSVREDIFYKQFNMLHNLIKKELQLKCNAIITEYVTSINRNIYYNISLF